MNLWSYFSTTEITSDSPKIDQKRVLKLSSTLQGGIREKMWRREKGCLRINTWHNSPASLLLFAHTHKNAESAFVLWVLRGGTDEIPNESMSHAQFQHINQLNSPPKTQLPHTHTHTPSLIISHTVILQREKKTNKKWLNFLKDHLVYRNNFIKSILAW